MRILRIFTFLLITTGMFASELPAQQALQPPHDFAADFRDARVPPVQQYQIPFPGRDRIDANEHNCYFIRSYIMKREGETGATHLDRITTCTPQSRIRMKSKVKFTPAVEQPAVVK